MRPGRSFLAAADPRFGANAVRLHEELREADLCLTHSLIPPQANRSVGPAGQADPFLAARVKAETDSGLVVRGCRMLATLPISDAIMVLPSTLLKATVDDAPVRVRLRHPQRHAGPQVHLPRERRLRPLALRPSARLALRGDGRRRRFRRRPRAVGERAAVPRRRALQRRARAHRRGRRHGAPGRRQEHRQIRVRAGPRVACSSTRSAVESFQHIQEKLAELWVTLETMRALLRAAEADAALDEWGVMRPAWNPLDAARNLFPRLYPRMIEIIAADRRQRPRRHADRARPARARSPTTSGVTTKRRGPMPSSAFRCFDSPGMPRSRRSPVAKCSTSGSSSATPYAWRALWSLRTTPKFAATPTACASSCASCATRHSPEKNSVSPDGEWRNDHLFFGHFGSTAASIQRPPWFVSQHRFFARSLPPSPLPRLHRQALSAAAAPRPRLRRCAQCPRKRPQPPLAIAIGKHPELRGATRASKASGARTTCAACRRSGPRISARGRR